MPVAFGNLSKSSCCWNCSMCSFAGGTLCMSERFLAGAQSELLLVVSCPDVVGNHSTAEVVC